MPGTRARSGDEHSTLVHHRENLHSGKPGRQVLPSTKYMKMRPWTPGDVQAFRGHPNPSKPMSLEYSQTDNTVDTTDRPSCLQPGQHLEQTTQQRSISPPNSRHWTRPESQMSRGQERIQGYGSSDRSRVRELLNDNCSSRTPLDPRGGLPTSGADVLVAARLAYHRDSWGDLPLDIMGEYAGAHPVRLAEHLSLDPSHTVLESDCFKQMSLESQYDPTLLQTGYPIMLADRLAAFGLEEDPCALDGNSQFHALARQLAIVRLTPLHQHCLHLSALACLAAHGTLLRLLALHHCNQRWLWHARFVPNPNGEPSVAMQSV